MTKHLSSWQAKIGVTSELTSDDQSTYVSLIDSQSVLEVRGEDAEKFLQGQCSADMVSLQSGDSVPGCICTVKGRVLCSFIATKQEQRILLRMSAELIQPLSEYLGKYAAFFNVELIDWPTPCVIEVKGLSLDTEAIELNYQLPGQAFNERLIETHNLDALVEELSKRELKLAGEQLWIDRQIDSGWLNLTAATTEKYLPHQLNLERLGAISFTKGCYTGQEIIARTEYRGKPKRRMQLIEISGADGQGLNLPTDIHETSSQKTIGELLNISTRDTNTAIGLGILPIESPSQQQVDIDQTQVDLKILQQPYPASS